MKYRLYYFNWIDNTYLNTDIDAHDIIEAIEILKSEIGTTCIKVTRIDIVY